MNRKAVLLFANPIGLDLARRRWPRLLRPLLSLRQLDRPSGGTDFHLFTADSSSAPLPGFQVHQQRGATFADRLDAATTELADLGYEEIVIIGSDCPSLTSGDIAIAFRQLATKRLVLGPDHRGGCYLIAFHARDRHLLRSIRWNCNSDFEQLGSRVDRTTLVSLAIKQDVDNWADLRLLARAGHRLVRFVLELLFLKEPIQNLFVDLSAQALRVRGQMPPPLPTA